MNNLNFQKISFLLTFLTTVTLRYTRSGREKNAKRASIARHKTCFILWRAIVAHPKDLWRAIKIFWDIITKIAPKIYLQLWRRSHWPDRGVSEECSKSEHLNGGLPVLSAPIASSEVNYRNESVCNMSSEGMLTCFFRCNIAFILIN